jgi:hypothetical protein
VRIGGLVEPGSLEKNGQDVRFRITDLTRTVTVTYRGLLPDAVMRALVRLMCAQWVRTFECGGDVPKQAFYKKKYFEKLRASAGALSAEVSAFISDYSDYIYAAPVGGIEDGLPIVVYTATDARFTGVEAEFTWRGLETALGSWNLRVFGDYVRAEDGSGAPLPQIPPLRLGGSVGLDRGPLIRQIGRAVVDIARQANSRLLVIRDFLDHERADADEDPSEAPSLREHRASRRHAPTGLRRRPRRRGQCHRVGSASIGIIGRRRLTASCSHPGRAPLAHRSSAGPPRPGPVDLATIRRWHDCCRRWFPAMADERVNRPSSTGTGSPRGVSSTNG